MKKLMIFALAFFLIGVVFAGTQNFFGVTYYEEVIDIGVQGYTENAVSVAVTVYCDYECYFSRNYLLSDAESIPFFLEHQMDSETKVKYEFFDSNSNLIDKKEVDLNLMIYPGLPAPYLCVGNGCKEEDTQVYYFWKNELIFLDCAQDTNGFTYDIKIEAEGTGGGDESTVLLSERNIELPYLIKSNMILGYQDYVLTLEMKETASGKVFLKKIDFTLLDYEKEEYDSLVRESLYPQEVIDENVGNEGQEKAVETTISNNTEKESKGSQATQKDDIDTGHYLLFVFLLLLLFIAMVSFLMPKANNKREDRRKREKAGKNEREDRIKEKR